MDKNSNLYTFGFAAVVTVLVAVSLTFVTEALSERKAFNELNYKKRDILSGVMDVSAMSDEQVQQTFDEKISQVIVNNQGNIIEAEGISAIDIDLKKEKRKPLEEQMLPLFVAKTDDGSNFIVPVRGNGLWDEIWGFIALEQDLNTIKGVAFDHKGETPGLGAEIKDNTSWKGQFIGKKLFDESGEFRSVDVVKGGVKDPEHQVDAISGATITGTGVEAMIESDIQKYVAYFSASKSSIKN